MHSIKLEQFEGPLDLLLQLIEKEELDITTVSLAKIADEFLDYIHRIEEIVPEEVADFLVVAAKLIYLKSKYLLPNLVVEEEDAGDLEKQLKIYQQYYQASKLIEKMIGKKKFTYVRLQPMKIKLTAEFSPPPKISIGQLAQAFVDVLSRLDEVRKLPKMMIAKAVSIKERINQLRDELLKNFQSKFSNFYNKENKVDTIVSFLALLELVKQRTVTVNQDKLFSDIDISLNSNHHE